MIFETVLHYIHVIKGRKNINKGVIDEIKLLHLLRRILYSNTENAEKSFF